MRRGAAVSARRHTGHSDDNHCPEACISFVVRFTRPRARSTSVVQIIAILSAAEGLAHDLEPACERRVAEAHVPPVRLDDAAERLLFGIGELNLCLG